MNVNEISVAILKTVRETVGNYQNMVARHHDNRLKKLISHNRLKQLMSLPEEKARYWQKIYVQLHKRELIFLEGIKLRLDARINAKECLVKRLAVIEQTMKTGKITEKEAKKRRTTTETQIKESLQKRLGEINELVANMQASRVKRAATS